MVPKYLMGESKLSGISTRFTIEGFPTIPKLCSGGDTVHRADRLCRGGVGRLLRVHEGRRQRHPPQVARPGRLSLQSWILLRNSPQRYRMPINGLTLGCLEPIFTKLLFEIT